MGTKDDWMKDMHGILHLYFQNRNNDCKDLCWMADPVCMEAPNMAWKPEELMALDECYNNQNDIRRT